MLGAIIGDTVGSIYEFHNTKDYDFSLFTNRSNYTDDTVMTMAVADWLLNSPEHDTDRLAQIFRHYGRTYRCPMGGYGHGFRLWLGDKTMGPYNSWGNGAAMRASAVGWMFDTLEETEHVAELTASVTHNHPEGIKGAQATAAAIFMARTGSSKDEIKDYISKRFDYNLARDYETLHEIYDWDSSCQGTVPEAIIAFLNSKNFEDSIRKAVSLGGDSDTLACINGGIAEAFYKEIPDSMSRPVLSRLNADFRALLDRFKKETNYWIVPSFPEVEPEAEKSKPQEIQVETKKKKSIWSQMIHLFKEQEPVFKYEQKDTSKPANIKGMDFHRPSAANRRAWAEEQRRLELQEMPEITDPEVVALRQYVKGKWTMGDSHGLPHWDNVYKNGILLQDEGVNERIVQRFAYLHDFCKQDDVKDREHGPRVAEWMVSIRDSLLKSLSDEEFFLLQEACQLHTSTENTGNPTIDACFDADRLDLARVGITPSPDKMATTKGRELAQKYV